jgi:acetoin utilization deacetylase AcuC-like enzyme
MMLPFHVVYHEGYDLNLGDHVFPSQKFRMIRQSLIRNRLSAPEDFVEPEPATDEDVLLAHDPEYIRKLKTGTLSYQELLRLEIPYSSRTVEAYWLAAGGTILAAQLAARERIGFNLGGGFHHGFPAHGEGFCAINDIAIAVRRAQKDGLFRRPMVVDCDVHHGNGTAAIFAADESVYTLSIHQYNNYPAEKPPSNMDIHLADRTGNEEYLDKLSHGLRLAFSAFHPDLVVYVAGADPYCEDQLGGLDLTMEGLRQRDQLVIESALEKGAAVAVVLAGGYAYDVTDTVEIQCNTVKVARDALLAAGSPKTA